MLSNCPLTTSVAILKGRICYERPLHHFCGHHRLAAAQEGQPGGADYRRRAGRVDAGRLRSRRHARAPARAQRRRNADLFGRAFRARARRHPRPLPGHDHAGLDGRPIRRWPRARRHAASAPRHGIAGQRLGQFSDPRLRQRARPRGLAGLGDEGIRHQAGDRGVRLVDDLSGGRPAERRQDRRAVAPPVRDGHQERHAGRSRGLRVLRAHAGAARARRDLDRGRHRPGAAHARQVVARAGRPLPHRPRGQRPSRSRHAGAVERGAREAGSRPVRRTIAVRRRSTRRGTCCVCLPRNALRSPPSLNPCIIRTPCREHLPPTPSS